MKKEIIQINEIKLIGLKTRTNNKIELNPSTGKIWDIVMNKYYGEGCPDKIPNRVNAGNVFCAYTEYESDHTGEYTYFIGEEVSSFDEIPKGFSTLVIQKGSYTKFTTDAGPMPDIIRDAWQEIWLMNSDDFGGKRSYKTDFELYNQENHDADPNKTVADIYIGIDLAL